MKLIGTIPEKVYLACSGGVDSMVVLNYLLKGKRDVELLFYHHNTKTSDEALEFLNSFVQDTKLKLHVGYYNSTKKTENDWRNGRYEFFAKFKDRPIITCHQLDDNIETFFLSTIKGTPKFIPYDRDNIIRPFLLVSKKEFYYHAKRNNIKWAEDITNSQNDHDRNKIRNLVLPVFKEINQGLDKTFFKKCMHKYKNDGLKIAC